MIGVVELRFGLEQILAAAQGQTPVIQGQLVLNVDTDVLGFLVVILKRAVGDVAEVLPVNRVGDVAGRRGAVLPFVVVIETLIVEPQQHSVFESARVEVGLQVVVQRELGDVFVHDVGAALDGAILADRTEEATGRYPLKGQVALGVADVLLELPDVVQTMLEGIAQRVIGFVVELPVRIAEVFVVLHAAYG